MPTSRTTRGGRSGGAGSEDPRLGRRDSDNCAGCPGLLSALFTLSCNGPRRGRRAALQIALEKARALESGSYRDDRSRTAKATAQEGCGELDRSIPRGRSPVCESKLGSSRPRTATLRRELSELANHSPGFPTTLRIAALHDRARARRRTAPGTRLPHLENIADAGPAFQAVAADAVIAATAAKPSKPPLWSDSRRAAIGGGCADEAVAGGATHGRAGEGRGGHTARGCEGATREVPDRCWRGPPVPSAANRSMRGTRGGNWRSSKALVAGGEGAVRGVRGRGFDGCREVSRLLPARSGPQRSIRETENRRDTAALLAGWGGDPTAGCRKRLSAGRR